MRRTLGSIALIAALSASVASAQPAGESDASADLNPEDCPVFVALGRGLLHWSQTPPDKVQFAIFYRPSGGGYVEQCPWAKLGVTPVPPGEPDANNMHFFTAPVYSGGGRSAAVSFVVRLKGVGVLINQTDCKLEKVDDRWRLIGCSQGPMT